MCCVGPTKGQVCRTNALHSLAGTIACIYARHSTGEYRRHGWCLSAPTMEGCHNDRTHVAAFFSRLPITSPWLVGMPYSMPDATTPVIGPNAMTCIRRRVLHMRSYPRQVMLERCVCISKPQQATAALTISVCRKRQPMPLCGVTNARGEFCLSDRYK